MIFCENKKRRIAALMLIDLLIYISLLAFVLVLAGVVFNSGMVQGGHLRRNIADIERAMKAGERWRADVRAATAPPRLEQQGGAEFFFIPQGTNEIAYSCQSNRVYRFTSAREGAELALGLVKATQMVPEKRAFASGWKWEVELERRQKTVHVRPMFTFMAVP